MVQVVVEARKKRILEKESGRTVAANVDNSSSNNDSQSSTHLSPIIAPVVVSDDVRATGEQDEVDQYGELRLRAKKTRREMQPVPEMMVLDIPPGVGPSRSEVGGAIMKRRRVIGKQRPESSNHPNVPSKRKAEDEGERQEMRKTTKGLRAVHTVGTSASW